MCIVFDRLYTLSCMLFLNKPLLLLSYMLTHLHVNRFFPTFAYACAPHLLMTTSLLMIIEVTTII